MLCGIIVSLVDGERPRSFGSRGAAEPRRRSAGLVTSMYLRGISANFGNDSSGTLSRESTLLRPPRFRGSARKRLTPEVRAVRRAGLPRESD
jgi:hypothetical protein